MHAFDQLVLTGLSMSQAQGPKANVSLGKALVDRGGAKGWWAGGDMTGALRVEVCCDATRGWYPSSVWGGGTRHQMTQAPAGVREEEEHPCCLGAQQSAALPGPFWMLPPGMEREEPGGPEQKQGATMRPPPQGNHRRTRVLPKKHRERPRFPGK